ncbi:hypothetical protein H310_14059 [Aphanomyces invadans]|uniref:Uncharacterized protein n=1 Tax=Aphanomyces invadans TaxID=157072 RepID=A0A024TBL0_9STRA|nr:hypothetical protein H310_14059 [Aphanomyces invadans]ETV91384.1 hypothetical protein H310_14059 [Aphanomyces invadans]|eukprot:XP_008880012.1 hypothetical protein H310_14059 [Aphanomyces invadans]
MAMQTSTDLNDVADDSSHDIVLSREDYDLLHAFHRLIPLPALSSGITRIVCEEDLQVPDDDDAASAPVTTKRKSHVETVRQLRASDPTPSSPGHLKPRFVVNLAKASPRQAELRPESS